MKENGKVSVTFVNEDEVQPHSNQESRKPKNNNVKTIIVSCIALAIVAAIGLGVIVITKKRASKNSSITEKTNELVDETTEGNELFNDLTETETESMTDIDTESTISEENETEEDTSSIFILFETSTSLSYSSFYNATNSTTEQKIKISNVLGLSESSAVSVLKEQGLRVNVQREYNKSVEYGKVISQSPKGGNMAVAGDTVTIIISNGKQSFQIYDVVGYDESTATSILQNQGFIVRINREYSNTVSYGRVIKQSPNAGSTGYEGDTVTITVSRGPQTVTTLSPIYSSSSTSSRTSSSSTSRATTRTTTSTTRASTTTSRTTTTATSQLAISNFSATKKSYDSGSKSCVVDLSWKMGSNYKIADWIITYNITRKDSGQSSEYWTVRCNENCKNKYYSFTQDSYSRTFNNVEAGDIINLKLTVTDEYGRTVTKTARILVG